MSFSNVAFGSMDGSLDGDMGDMGLVVDMFGPGDTSAMPRLNEYGTNGIEGYHFGATAASGSGGGAMPLQRAPAADSAGTSFLKELGKGSLEVGKAVAIDKFTKKAPPPVTNIINNGMSKKVLLIGGGVAALALAFYLYNRSSNPSAQVS